MSVLANATLPLSGLRRSSGSGLIPLQALQRARCEMGMEQLPNESVDLLDGMLNLVEGIGGLDAQLKN